MEQFKSSLVDLPEVLANLSGKAMDEIFQQRQNIIPSLPKGWHLDREHVEPVKEVGTKSSICGGGFEIAIGCRNHPNIDLDGLFASHPLKFPLLQHSQECHLGIRGQLTDFIEENGSAVRQLKTAQPALRRAGERSFLVAKQLGGNQ